MQIYAASNACMDRNASQGKCRALAFIDLTVTFIQLILALLILIPILIGAVSDILFIQNNENYRDAELISVVELIVLVLIVIVFSTQLWASYRLLVICNPVLNPKDDVCSSQIYCHVTLMCIVLQTISLHRFHGPFATNLFSAIVLIFRCVALFYVNRFKKGLMRQYSAVSISSVIIFPQPEPDNEDLPEYTTSNFSP